MLEFVLLAVLGLAAGIIAGLVPGIHPNLLAAFLVSISTFLLTFLSPVSLMVFIVAMAISNTFLNFIPSVFVGAPDEGSTSLSVLPGHSLLLQGRGYEAVYLTVVGGMGVILLSILLMPLIFVALPVLYYSVKFYVAWVLIFVVMLMILTERGYGKLKGALIFLMSGILGMIILNTPLIPSSQVLFPVFTGLFGVSTLIISMLSRFTIPKQTKVISNMPKKTSLGGIVKGFVSGMVVGILPGIGPSQAGVVVYEVTRKKNTREFLISLGGINTVSAFFSLLALFLINRPRSGVAVAVDRILDSFGLGELLMIIAATLFAAGVSAVLTLKLSGHFLKFVQKVDYQKLNIGIILFLIISAMVLTGWFGLIVLFVSTSIGLLAPLLKVKRTHLMGVLILPIILFFFGYG